MHAFDVRECTLHVPLVMRGPHVPAGGSVAPRVGLVDVAPTILEVFGAAPPPVCEGRSLWPLIRGDDVESEEPAWGSLPVDPDEFHADALPRALVIWQRQYKLLVERARTSDVARCADHDGAALVETTHLFDVEADPRQEKDVAAEHPEIVRALRKRLDECVASALATKHAPGELTREGHEMMAQLGYVAGPAHGR